MVLKQLPQKTAILPRLRCVQSLLVSVYASTSVRTVLADIGPPSGAAIRHRACRIDGAGWACGRRQPEGYENHPVHSKRSAD